MKKIYYGKAVYDYKEINAVNKVLEYINFIDTLVEAAYLMYLNLCNGYPPDEAEDLEEEEPVLVQ